MHPYKNINPKLLNKNYTCANKIEISPEKNVSFLRAMYPFKKCCDLRLLLM
jgi:hypothetical protein